MKLLVTLDDSSIHHNQSHFTIFLESARNALKTHQWPVLNQCVLAMVRTLPTTIKCPTVLWTATILIRGFRSWLGIQVGIWLIQKGYFNEGFELVKEWHTKPCRESGLAFLSKQHPKKHMVLYLGEFIMAMMRYSTWKRDILAIRQEEDHLLGHEEDEESVERAGNIALTSFEYLYQYQTDTNADVMSFIEPFVELLIEYRSVNRAKEIVEEVYERNPGNMFVEKFYFSFLEQHFPHECTTEEFSERKEKFNNKYTYEKDPTEGIKGRLKFNKWKADRKRDGNIVRLKQLPTPDFAWD
ncbi:hypothetical protein Ocin01_01002 [Orchesella cincta]|uniref:Uncharacterized protein n=1 Tax=Orchesella cincta TaxID=48709 RepID=A0A1D2NKB6_ORCCI|nr:hypothetical protein Ocin01_01002 [Orchesella cincta]